MDIQITDVLNDLSVSIEHFNNLMKMVEGMVNSVAFGDVKEDETKASEYIDCLATLVHFMIKISEQESAKFYDLLHKLTNEYDISLKST